MKKATEKKTELVCILDRSGSMGGLESDTIGGFWAMLSEQKKLPGKLSVTTVLFDHLYEPLYTHCDIKNVPPLTEKEYFVRGSTAMLDAVGLTINQMKKDFRKLPKEEKPNDVIFFITTDGYENASTRFSYADIHKKIENAKTKHGWHFIFSAANIDEKEVGTALGIDEDYILPYAATGEGVRKNLGAVCDACCAIRLEDTPKPKAVKP